MMARYFTGGEDLSVLTPVVTAHPLTMACWFNPDNVTAYHTLMGITDTGADTQWQLAARGNTGGDPVSAAAVVAGAYEFANTTSGFSAGAWQHACGVFTSNILRAAYLNGGNKGTNVGNRSPSSLDKTYLVVGSGSLAEAAIWNIALSDAEVALLAKGVSPLMVRPESLVSYVPLIRDNDQDIIGGYSFTPGGTPEIRSHPRIFYPSPTLIMSLLAPPVVGNTRRSYGTIFG